MGNIIGEATYSIEAKISKASLMFSSKTKISIAIFVGIIDIAGCTDREFSLLVKNPTPASFSISFSKLNLISKALSNEANFTSLLITI